MTEEKHKSLNFIEQIIEEDIANGKHGGNIITRFPPEPNGYLHIGHAKAICVNFEIAKKYGGKANLRFDDTNPTTEETEYVEAIKRDIKWLGYEWAGEELYASNYFEELYGFAMKLIEDGNAYVDDSTPEQIAALKGTPTEPGKDGQNRSRPIEENIRLFKEMREGLHPDGSLVVRAKIDMASPNMLMRDPLLYRIKHQHHHRTGDAWCIYPMYDFAHGQSDSIENITHSLCSLEFRHHRDVYDWLIEKLGIFPSRQIEFARMNVAYMITSKRNLMKLIQTGYVNGWDDPRMPTISGMRRRGYPASALRIFCDKVGVAKRDNLIELELLESCVRDELNRLSTRVMVVMDPLKLTITNYEGDGENLLAENNPEIEGSGEHNVPFSKTLYIEQDDFMLDPPKKFFRLAVGSFVRLKHAFIIECTGFVQDENGKVTEVLAKYYPESRSGQDNSGLKAKGTLHWVSAKEALPITINKYDKIFTDPEPLSHEGRDIVEFVNKDSHRLYEGALAEPHLAEVTLGEHLQFMRQGYFIKDTDSVPDSLLFNETIGLKSSWSAKK